MGNKTNQLAKELYCEYERLVNVYSWQKECKECMADFKVFVGLAEYVEKKGK